MSPGQESVDKYLNANYPSEVEAYKKDLRAKVEAMPGAKDIWLYREDVLALIDEADP